MEKILDGGSSCKKLWVAENLEVDPWSVKRELHCVRTRVSNAQQLRWLTVSSTSSAVLHGTVDFSTMMAPGRAC